ncbi:hypothetical protein CLF_111512, partial [Clonorchis sinensis]
MFSEYISVQLVDLTLRRIWFLEFPCFGPLAEDLRPNRRNSSVQVTARASSHSNNQVLRIHAQTLISNKLLDLRVSDIDLKLVQSFSVIRFNPSRSMGKLWQNDEPIRTHFLNADYVYTMDLSVYVARNSDQLDEDGFLKLNSLPTIGVMEEMKPADRVASFMDRMDETMEYESTIAPNSVAGQDTEDEEDAGPLTPSNIIITIDSMTSVLNTDASPPYNHDLFESLIVKKKNKDGRGGDLLLPYYNHSE